MNCFIIKNLFDNSQHVYYGKKSIHEYTTSLIDRNDINDFIIEKKSDDLLHILKKIIHTGYLYNSTSFENIFIIERISIELDPKQISNEYRKLSQPKIDDEFLRELKDTLSKRLKNKLE